MTAHASACGHPAGYVAQELDRENVVIKIRIGHGKRQEHHAALVVLAAVDIIAESIAHIAAPVADIRQIQGTVETVIAVILPGPLGTQLRIQEVVVKCLHAVGKVRTGPYDQYASRADPVLDGRHRLCRQCGRIVIIDEQKPHLLKGAPVRKLRGHEIHRLILRLVVIIPVIGISAVIAGQTVLDEVQLIGGIADDTELQGSIGIKDMTQLGIICHSPLIADYAHFSIVIPGIRSLGNRKRKLYVLGGARRNRNISLELNRAHSVLTVGHLQLHIAAEILTIILRAERNRNITVVLIEG